MRKVLATALALVATSMAAFSQTAEVLETRSIPQPDSREIYPLSAKSDPFSSSSAVEQRYGWISRHFFILNDQGFDVNIRNFGFPISLGQNQAGQDVEIRGAGQLFAPGVIYNYFNSIYTGRDTALLAINDKEAYMAQFKGAKQFTIDSIICQFFKNPYQTDLLTAGVKFYVWQVPTFTGTGTYQTNGYVGSRSALTEMYKVELTQDDMDATINGSSFVSTLFVFSNPLTFNDKQAAIAMFVNDDLPPATNTQVVPTNTSEYQVMRGYFERLDTTAKKRLQLYKSLGTTIYRTVVLNGANPGNYDSVRTIWSTLIYGQAPDTTTAPLDMGFTFIGSVELASGVTYRYGTDATSQGLNAVTPNPARETAKVNFSLTEIAPVTLDLYNATGEKIRTLVTARYIPGIYSYDLPVSDLQSGTYLVRMTAGEKVYTTKVNVVK